MDRPDGNVGPFLLLALLKGLGLPQRTQKGTEKREIAAVGIAPQ
jgi:hypothetical protein